MHRSVQQPPIESWHDRGCIIRVRPHHYGGLTYEIDLGDGKVTTTRPRFVDFHGLRIGVALALDALLNPFRLRRV